MTRGESHFRIVLLRVKHTPTSHPHYTPTHNYKRHFYVGVCRNESWEAGYSRSHVNALKQTLLNSNYTHTLRFLTHPEFSWLRKYIKLRSTKCWLIKKYISKENTTPVFCFYFANKQNTFDTVQFYHKQTHTQPITHKMWLGHSNIIDWSEHFPHWPTCCTFHIIWISTQHLAPYDIVLNNGHCSYNYYLLVFISSTKRNTV